MANCWCSIKSRKSDSVVGPSAVFRTTSARDHRARWLAFVDGVKNQLSISSADGSAPGHRSDRARPISAVSPANPGFFPSSQEASATDRSRSVRGTESLQTHCWRGVDSNYWFRNVSASPAFLRRISARLSKELCGLPCQAPYWRIFDSRGQRAKLDLICGPDNAGRAYGQGAYAVRIQRFAWQNRLPARSCDRDRV